MWVTNLTQGLMDACATEALLADIWKFMHAWYYFVMCRRIKYYAQCRVFRGRANRKTLTRAINVHAMFDPPSALDTHVNATRKCTMHVLCGSTTHITTKIEQKTLPKALNWKCDLAARAWHQLFSWCCRGAGCKERFVLLGRIVFASLQAFNFAFQMPSRHMNPWSRAFTHMQVTCHLVVHTRSSLGKMSVTCHSKTSMAKSVCWLLHEQIE